MLADMVERVASGHEETMDLLLELGEPLRVVISKDWNGARCLACHERNVMNVLAELETGKTGVRESDVKASDVLFFACGFGGVNLCSTAARTGRGGHVAEDGLEKKAELGYIGDREEHEGLAPRRERDADEGYDGSDIQVEQDRWRSAYIGPAWMSFKSLTGNDVCGAVILNLSLS